VVIADTDLLSDFMWVQQRNFFGQTMAQPFANNGELAWNALDNLAAAPTSSVSAVAPPTRARSTASKRCVATPTRVPLHGAAARNTASADRGQLNKLQSAQPGGDAILSPQAREAIDQFQERKAAHPQGTAQDEGRARAGHQVAGHAAEARQRAHDAASSSSRRVAGVSVAQAPPPRHRDAAQRERGMNQKKFLG
jgi:hypothetical protein